MSRGIFIIILHMEFYMSSPSGSLVIDIELIDKDTFPLCTLQKFQHLQKIHYCRVLQFLYSSALILEVQAATMLILLIVGN